MVKISKKNIIFSWLFWYLKEVPKNILKAFKNFLKFCSNYFSIFLLLKSYFSYWRKYKWSYGKSFNIGKYIEVFFSNLLSRILGAIIRTFFIILGILVEIFIIILGGFIFLGWYLLPILLIGGFFLGFKAIF